MSCGLVIQDQSGPESQPNVEDQSKNFSGAGTHCKITYFKANQLGIQHSHKYNHLSVLLEGTVMVSGYDPKTDNTFQKLMKAEHGIPCSIIIEAGVEHKVWAMTDAVWMCIHNTLNSGEIPLE